MKLRHAAALAKLVASISPDGDVQEIADQEIDLGNYATPARPIGAGKLIEERLNLAPYLASIRRGHCSRLLPPSRHCLWY
jgi:hypothetical protein